MPKKLSKRPDYATTQKVHSENLEWLKWLDWPSMSLFARAYQTMQLPKDKNKPALKKENPTLSKQTNKKKTPKQSTEKSIHFLGVSVVAVIPFPE